MCQFDQVNRIIYMTLTDWCFSLLNLILYLMFTLFDAARNFRRKVAEIHFKTASQ